MRAFMGHPPLGSDFRPELETFVDVTGAKISVLGEEAVGNPSFVGRNCRGSSPSLRMVERVCAEMAAYASTKEV